jgi:hypothetical protein
MVQSVLELVTTCGYCLQPGFECGDYYLSQKIDLSLNNREQVGIRTHDCSL